MASAKAIVAIINPVQCLRTHFKENGLSAFKLRNQHTILHTKTREHPDLTLRATLLENYFSENQSMLILVLSIIMSRAACCDVHCLQRLRVCLLILAPSRTPSQAACCDLHTLVEVKSLRFTVFGETKSCPHPSVARERAAIPLTRRPVCCGRTQKSET